MDDFIDFFKMLMVLFLSVFLFVVMIVVFVLGYTWFCAGFESRAWNKLHGTSYSRSDWFGGSEFIEKYHYPNRDEAVKGELNVNQN